MASAIHRIVEAGLGCDGTVSPTRKNASPSIGAGATAPPGYGGVRVGFTDGVGRGLCVLPGVGRGPVWLGVGEGRACGLDPAGAIP